MHYKWQDHEKIQDKCTLKLLSNIILVFSLGQLIFILNVLINVILCENGR